MGLYAFQGNRQPGIPLSDPIAEQQRQAQIGLAEELVLRAFVQVSMSLSICPRRGASSHGHRTITNCACLLPAVKGGVLLIDGGGNTGLTTKAPFVSRVALDLLQSIDARSAPTEVAELEAHYEAICDRHRRSKTELTVCDWQQLEESLAQVMETAKKRSVDVGER